MSSYQSHSGNLDWDPYNPHLGSQPMYPTNSSGSGSSAHHSHHSHHSYHSHHSFNRSIGASTHEYGNNYDDGADYGSYESQGSFVDFEYQRANSPYQKASGSVSPGTEHNDCISPQDILIPIQDWGLPPDLSPGANPEPFSPLPPSPVNPTPSQSTVSGRRSSVHFCHVQGCQSKGFKRNTDLQRHLRSVHFPKFFDCEYAEKKRCNRSGNNGFTRLDHYYDHLREVHCVNKPKGTKVSKERKEQARASRR